MGNLARFRQGDGFGESSSSVCNNRKALDRKRKRKRRNEKRKGLLEVAANRGIFIGAHLQSLALQCEDLCAEARRKEEERRRNWRLSSFGSVPSW